MAETGANRYHQEINHASQCQCRQAAASQLFKARQEFLKLDSLPESCRPMTASDGYAIQEPLVEKLLCVDGARRLGYKIGATNPAARDMLGTGEPFAGVLISNFCHASP